VQRPPHGVGASVDRAHHRGDGTAAVDLFAKVASCYSGVKVFHRVDQLCPDLCPNRCLLSTNTVTYKGIQRFTDRPQQPLRGIVSDLEIS
jgi:hypothetical protein